MAIYALKHLVIHIWEVSLPQWINSPNSHDRDSILEIKLKACLLTLNVPTSNICVQIFGPDVVLYGMLNPF